MKVFDFILNNWFIVVVIYFILSGLLKRGKAQAKEAPAPKPAGKGMPSFGGGGRGAGWEKKTPGMSKGKAGKAAEEPSSRGTTAQKPAPRDSLTRPGRVLQEPSRGSVAESGDRLAALYPEGGGMPGEITAFQPAEKQTAIKPSAKRLAEGILWAEILGPPRSRKPFRK